MSTSFSNGRDHTLSQLLHAAKMKLQETMSSGRTVASISQAEVDVLENDASEVLSLIRSIKNSFASIDRIPPEVLSLVPGCYVKDRADQDLIKLTHVCSGWRNTFISCPPLWTQLDFKNVDKTRTYIYRSKSSPLDLYLEDGGIDPYLDDAFSLVIPHIHRLKSLVVCADDPMRILRHFRSRTPLLGEVHVRLASTHNHRQQIFDSQPFDGDLSSLRKLCLFGVPTHLPWNNVANLRVLNLSYSLGSEVTSTRLLDFLESAPLLQVVALVQSNPEAFNTPPGRMVSLPHLKTLTINVEPERSILNHLCIPICVSVRVWATFSGEESPLLDYLPETSPNLENLSRITMLNFRFDPGTKCAQLSGPSGSLRLVARPEGQANPSAAMDHRILRCLRPSTLSTIQRLSISNYISRNPTGVEDGSIFQMLSSANQLRTLVLSEGNLRPFISALNPRRNSSKVVLCPNLKELLLCSDSWGPTKLLINMARGRASSGAKLASMTMVFLDAPLPEPEVLKLGEYVTHMKYNRNSQPPLWDDLSYEGESNPRKRTVIYPGS